MNTSQAKFIEANVWVLIHPDFKKLRPIVESSPLLVALDIWETIPEDGATLEELAHRVGAHPNTIATVTRAMEKAGIVSRSKNPENRRQTLVQRKPSPCHFQIH